MRWNEIRVRKRRSSAQRLLTFVTGRSIDTWILKPVVEQKKTKISVSQATMLSTSGLWITSRLPVFMPKRRCQRVYIGSVASTRVQGWGDEPREPTVRLPDWSELVASYSRMKSAWGWTNGGQPILVCYIRKYVIILGGIFPLTSPPTKILGGCVPGIPGGVDASA